MKFLVTFFIVFVPFQVFSQTEEGLLKRIYREKNPAKRWSFMLALLEDRNIHRDTLTKYAYIARAMGSKVADQNSRARAELGMATMYRRWGWVDSGLVAARTGLGLAARNQQVSRVVRFRLLRENALLLGGANRLGEALSVLFQLVREAEISGDSLTLASGMNTLGSVALAREKPEEALRWLSNAMGYTKKEGRFAAVRSSILVNRGEAYASLNHPDSAAYLIGKGIEGGRQAHALDILAIALQKQSALFVRERKFKEAENALREMLHIRAKLGDGGVWVDDNLSLIHFYMETGQVDEAIAYSHRMLKEGDLYRTTDAQGRVLVNNIKIRLAYYELLAKCYRIKGNTTFYGDYLEKIIAAKDSFYEANSAQAIAELQTRYDVQKKENTIIQQQYSLLKKDYLFYGSVGLSGLAGLAVLFAFSDYRKRQKRRTARLLQEEKENTQKAVGLAEEKERRRIAADLHDNLGAYGASIVSNLEFIRPAEGDRQSDQAMTELRYNALSIVSQLSDTIWVLHKDAIPLTGISDRIKVFLQRISRSFPSVGVSVIEQVEIDRVFPAPQAYHLFRIIQEALSNALRHSEGSEITLTIRSEETWEISINDNGKGLPPDHIPGNGLNNMRSRAQSCHWEVDVLSGPAGTMVQVKPQPPAGS